jgi:hypothetical protein
MLLLNFFVPWALLADDLQIKLADCWVGNPSQSRFVKEAMEFRNPFKYAPGLESKLGWFELKI